MRSRLRGGGEWVLYRQGANADGECLYFTTHEPADGGGELIATSAGGGGCYGKSLDGGGSIGGSRMTRFGIAHPATARVVATLDTGQRVEAVVAEAPVHGWQFYVVDLPDGTDARRLEAFDASGKSLGSRNLRPVPAG